MLAERRLRRMLFACDTGDSAMPDSVRLTANLTPAVVSALKDIARARGVTLTEALHQAISHEKFLVDAAANNNKVLLENAKSGEIRELVFG